MKQFLLDTSILLHFMRSDSLVARQIEQDYKIASGPFRPAICVVSLGEIEAFFRSWGDKRVSSARSILSSFEVIDIHHQSVVSAYGKLHHENKSMGLGLGQNDLWIASATIASGLTLLSADKDFDRLITRPAMVLVDAKTGITEGSYL